MLNQVLKAVPSCLFALLWAFHLINVAQGTCPPVNNQNLWRLGTSQYYIIQTTNEDEKTNWEGAQKRCREYGMDLAVIDSFGEDAAVGRALEQSLSQLHNLHTNGRAVYWIGAKYILDSEAYVWQTERSNSIVNYNNILYDGTRSIGYGHDLSEDGNNWKPVNRPDPRCLAYGINFDTQTQHDILYDENCPRGHETRMTELKCEDRRFPMCEAKDCEDIQTKNDTIFTHNKEYYMTDGNWIFGNPRRFIINWQPRKKLEALEYCEERGMKLYHPTIKDGCLIPYLALWNKRITTANFWTDVTYFLGMNKFVFSDGVEIPEKKPYVNATTDLLEFQNPLKREEWISICAAASYSYQKLDTKACNCHWNSMTLIPANCGVKIATICSHVNEENEVQGSCGNYWGHGNTVYDRLDSPLERQRVINLTHSIPFANDNPNNRLYRSTYKQRFGNRLCPDNNRGYKLASNASHIPLPDDTEEDIKYKYDAEETYWVAHDTRGHTLRGLECMLSVYDKEKRTRIIKTGVYCNEWHFYLCERVRRRNRGKRAVLEEEQLEEFEPASNYYPDWD